MRKIKEVLRLRYELGLGERQIARSCSTGRGTVSEYLKRAEAAGLSWPLPAGWDDSRLEEALFGTRLQRTTTQARRPLPDFAAIREQLHPRRRLSGTFGRIPLQTQCKRSMLSPIREIWNTIAGRPELLEAWGLLPWLKRLEPLDNWIVGSALCSSAYMPFFTKRSWPGGVVRN